jgi:hypothetical protein
MTGSVREGKVGRAAIATLAVVALAFGLVSCGGSDEDPAVTDPISGSTSTGGEVTGGYEGEEPREEGPARSDRKKGAGPPTAGDPRDPEVDLAVRPETIPGGRVTPEGVVQTVPPDPAARRIAEKNGYSSINSFGEEAAGEEATDITFALAQYLSARAEGDWATACARLYSVVREGLEKGLEARPGSGCDEIYGTLMSRVPLESRLEQARIDVAAVRRGEDDRAFVVYKTPDMLSADMPMYVEDGVWKVGALEAYGLGPGEAG